MNRGSILALGRRKQPAYLFNYARHMAHSWVPKRAYGVGYPRRHRGIHMGRTPGCSPSSSLR
jgi:hypothetical protein